MNARIRTEGAGCQERGEVSSTAPAQHEASSNAMAPCDPSPTARAPREASSTATAPREASPTTRVQREASPTAPAHNKANPTAPVPLSDLERRFINHYQGGFPLVERPFVAVAGELGTDEATLIATLRGLLASGVLSRFGPLFDAERLGGRFTLAAMAVPEADFDRVAAQLAALPEVAHNYRRDHALNMWFVLATPSEQGLREVLGLIRDLTGLEVLDFPKLAEYHLGFWLHLDEEGGLGMRRWERTHNPGEWVRLAPEEGIPGSEETSPLVGETSSVVNQGSAGVSEAGLDVGEERSVAGDRRSVVEEPRTLMVRETTAAVEKILAPAVIPDELESALVTATQGGLPLVARPYAAIAWELGVSSARVRRGLAAMLERGAIRRIGAVPNHYRLGLRGNGMTVWDIEDEAVDRLGAAIAALAGVSHCYRRPRRLPLWPYNLFAMLHGRDRDEVRAAAARVAALVAGHCRGHDILFSQAVLKKTGLRFAGISPERS